VDVEFRGDAGNADRRLNFQKTFLTEESADKTVDQLPALEVGLEADKPSALIRSHLISW
jgi:hypothetical protein